MPLGLDPGVAVVAEPHFRNLAIIAATQGVIGCMAGSVYVSIPALGMTLYACRVLHLLYREARLASTLTEHSSYETLGVYRRREFREKFYACMTKENNRLKVVGKIALIALPFLCAYIHAL